MNIISRWLAERAERKSHRHTAANCKYWYGDNSPVDWGSCSLCPPLAF